MLLIDGHVHIYDCFDFEKFFDSAYSNFRSTAEQLNQVNNFIGILLLAENSSNNWYRHLSDYADGNLPPDNRITGSWTFRRTEENCSLYAKSESSEELFLIAGRQVVTAEGLEVLALIMNGSLKDGTPIEQMINEIKNKRGLPVIPWGFGKWFGRRGEILKNLIHTAKDSDFFLGDNSGRPFFWPRPSFFKKGEKNGISVLPGSDPLPVLGGYKRTGSFGFFIDKPLPDRNLSAFIKKELKQRSQCIQAYGKLEGLYTFIKNQVNVRSLNRGKI